MERTEHLAGGAHRPAKDESHDYIHEQGLRLVRIN